MKSICLSFLLLCCTLCCSAQTEQKNAKVLVGVKNSLVLSDFKRLIPEITAIRPGFVSGVQFDFIVNRFYSIRLGAQYVNKGFSITEYYPLRLNIEREDNLDMRFQTIEVPLLSVVKINVHPKVKFIQTIGVGLEYWGFESNNTKPEDFVIFALYDGSSSYPNLYKHTFDTDFEYDKKFGANLIAGAGVELELSKLLTLDLLLSYQLGLDRGVTLWMEKQQSYDEVSATYPRSYFSFDTILFFGKPPKS